MAHGTELGLEISTNPMRKYEIAVVQVYVVAINARYILDPTDKKNSWLCYALKKHAHWANIKWPQR